MPRNGLLTIKPLLNMLEIKSNKVARGQAFDKLQEYLEIIKKKTYFNTGLY